MKEKNILYTIIGYPFFMLLFHPKVIGRENINDSGLILCGNHKSPLDIFLLVSSTRRKIHFFSKIELFNTKFKNFFFRKMGCIPVNRKKKNEDALEEGYKCLNKNQLVAIFPEGTINKTNELIMPFKYGAVKMSKQTFKQILPFVIIGRYHIFGKSIKIVFDKPYSLKTNNLEIENEILMRKVTRLIKENTDEKRK